MHSHRLPFNFGITDLHAVANEWLIATQWYQDYCKSWRTSSVPYTGQWVPFADLLPGTPRQSDTFDK